MILDYATSDSLFLDTESHDLNSSDITHSNKVDNTIKITYYQGLVEVDRKERREKKKLKEKKEALPVIYKCPDCTREFDSIRSVHKHFLKIHVVEKGLFSKPPSFKCNHCQRVFLRDEDRFAHWVSKHTEITEDEISSISSEMVSGLKFNDNTPDSNLDEEVAIDENDKLDINQIVYDGTTPRWTTADLENQFVQEIICDTIEQDKLKSDNYKYFPCKTCGN